MLFTTYKGSGTRATYYRLCLGAESCFVPPRLSSGTHAGAHQIDKH